MPTSSVSSLLLLLAADAFAAPPLIAGARPPPANPIGACRVDLATCRVDLRECDADIDECDATIDDYDATIDELLDELTMFETATPARGGMARSLDGAVSVQVPPGAVSAPARIAVTPSEARVTGATPLSNVIEVTLLDADGNEVTRTGAPVEICLESDASKKDSACLGYLDESTREWKCEDQCLTSHGSNTVCGQTDHFTNFAILLSGTAGSGKGCDNDADAFGGTWFSEDRGALISLPPGAIRERAAITFDRVAQPPGGVERLSEVYDIGPDGATFLSPATVCLRTSAAPPPGACLGYVDESGRQPTWKCQDPCLKQVNDALCGETDHLTSFAILLSGGNSAVCAESD